MTPRREHIMRALELVLLQEYWDKIMADQKSMTGLTLIINQMITDKFQEEKGNPFFDVYRVLQRLDTNEGIEYQLWEVLERNVLKTHVPNSKHIIIRDVMFETKSVHILLDTSQKLFKSLLIDELLHPEPEESPTP